MISAFNGVIDVAAREDSFCVLLDAGIVHCATSPWSGGKPAAPNSAVRGAISITVGFRHTCSLLRSGKVVCWGSQCETGGGECEEARNLTPRVTEVTGLRDAVQIAAHHMHTCAVRKSGQVACWGNNDDGQLGDGTTVYRTLPVMVRGISDAIEVATGENRSCAVHNGGAVTCWGKGANKNWGTSKPAWPSEPVAVRGLVDAVHIAAGKDFTCSTRRSGNIACWGSARRGQLGNCTMAESLTPSEVQGVRDVAIVAAGNGYTCAAGHDGRVACWGRRMLARSQPAPPTTPQNPATSEEFRARIRVELDAMKRNSPSFERVKDLMDLVHDYDQSNPRLRPSLEVEWKARADERGFPPRLVDGIAGAIALDSGPETACAVSSSRQASCWWGGEKLRPLDNAQNPEPYHPLQIEGLRTVKMLRETTWSSHVAEPSFALLSSGQVALWTFEPALSKGSIVHVESQVIPGLTDVSNVAGNRRAACAVRRPGGVSCLRYTRAADGTVRATPISDIVGIDDAIRIAHSGGRFCALRKSGTVVCWNDNSLPEPTTHPNERFRDKQAPAPLRLEVLGSLSNPIDIVGGDAWGEDFFCALEQSGAVACWGENGHGQLGTGDFEPRDRPTHVSVLSDAMSITAGTRHACALRRCGNVVCWGDNQNLELGFDAQSYADFPVEVSAPER